MYARRMSNIYYIGYLVRSSVTFLFTVGYNIILNIHQQLHNKAKIKRKNGASRTNLSLNDGRMALEYTLNYLINEYSFIRLQF